MIELKEKELFKIIKESLEKDYSIKARDIKICLRWECMSHDRPSQTYYFDASKDWIPFISYHDGFSYKELTVEEIKMYLKARYPENQFILLNYRIKNDSKLLKTSMEVDDEWRALANFSMEIHYDDEAELSKSDIKDLIELSLKLNDKSWFQELVDRYKSLNSVNNKKENA